MTLRRFLLRALGFTVATVVVLLAFGEFRRGGFALLMGGVLFFSLLSDAVSYARTARKRERAEGGG